MNFEQARYNMVEQQIRPWEVLDFGVLDLLMGETPYQRASPNPLLYVAVAEEEDGSASAQGAALA